MNQDKFASLEGTTGSFFITVCCETVQKLVWLTIYLSAKFDAFSDIDNYSYLPAHQTNSQVPQPTYFWTSQVRWGPCLPTCLLTCLLTYLPTQWMMQPSCKNWNAFKTSLPLCTCAIVHAYLPTNLPSHQSLSCVASSETSDMSNMKARHKSLH